MCDSEMRKAMSPTPGSGPVIVMALQDLMVNVATAIRDMVGSRIDPSVLGQDMDDLIAKVMCENAEAYRAANAFPELCYAPLLDN